MHCIVARDWLRRESHYVKNDSNVTFRRSHFTFHTVTVAMRLTDINVAMALPATAMVTVTTKRTFGKLRQQFSVDLVSENGSDGCRS